MEMEEKANGGGGGGGGSDLAEEMISQKGQTVTKGSEKCSCIVLLFFSFSFNKSVYKTVLSCTILLFKQASFLTFCVLASFKVCWLLAPFFPVFLFLSFNFKVRHLTCLSFLSKVKHKVWCVFHSCLRCNNTNIYCVFHSHLRWNI